LWTRSPCGAGRRPFPSAAAMSDGSDLTCHRSVCRRTSRKYRTTRGRAFPGGKKGTPLRCPHLLASIVRSAAMLQTRMRSSSAPAEKIRYQERERPDMRAHERKKFIQLPYAQRFWKSAEPQGLLGSGCTVQLIAQKSKRNSLLRSSKEKGQKLQQRRRERSTTTPYKPRRRTRQCNEKLK
jgi:hypothetical protein